MSAEISTEHEKYLIVLKNLEEYRTSHDMVTLNSSIEEITSKLVKPRALKHVKEVLISIYGNIRGFKKLCRSFVDISTRCMECDDDVFKMFNFFVQFSSKNSLPLYVFIVQKAKGQDMLRYKAYPHRRNKHASPILIWIVYGKLFVSKDQKLNCGLIRGLKSMTKS